MDREREGDQSKISAPARRSDEASQGASDQEVTKIPSSDAGHPAKSPERSSLTHVATTLRKPSVSPTDTAFGRILELYHHHFIPQPEATHKQPTRTAKFDVKAPPEAHIDDPPKLPDGYDPKPSPLLRDAARGVVFQAAAVELDQENQELAVNAEKHDRHLQQSRDSYYRTKEADPEVQREKWRVKQANYRARKRQEAKTQEVQKPPDNRS